MMFLIITIWVVPEHPAMRLSSQCNLITMKNYLYCKCNGIIIFSDHQNILLDHNFMTLRQVVFILQPFCDFHLMADENVSPMLYNSEGLLWCRIWWCDHLPWPLKHMIRPQFHEPRSNSFHFTAVFRILRNGRQKTSLRPYRWVKNVATGPKSFIWTQRTSVPSLVLLSAR